MHNSSALDSGNRIAQQLQSGLLATLKSECVGKDEVIDLLGI